VGVFTPQSTSMMRIAIAIIYTIIYNRLTTIIRFPIRPDSLSALASLLEELFFTLRKWDDWKEYYSSQLETRNTLG
jgi:hypothetical protein